MHYLYWNQTVLVLLAVWAIVWWTNLKNVIVLKYIWIIQSLNCQRLLRRITEQSHSISFNSMIESFCSRLMQWLSKNEREGLRSNELPLLSWAMGNFWKIYNCIGSLLNQMAERCSQYVFLSLVKEVINPCQMLSWKTFFLQLPSKIVFNPCFGTLQTHSVFWCTW